MSIVTYPQYIKWELSLAKKISSLECFSPEIAKKIPKSLSRLQAAGYTFVFEAVDASYMEKFHTLYVQNISQKENPKIFEVKGKIAEKLSKGETIEALSLYKNNTYLGGSIYRVLDEKFSVIYRTFQKEFEISLPVNVGIAADSLVYQKAIDEKKTDITHGRDRNLYGLHSDIGLAQFKLLVGCAPYISNNQQVIFSREKNDFEGASVKILEGTDPLLLQNIQGSKECVLMFLGSESNAKIEKAILYTRNTDPEFLKKHNYLFKNPNFTTEVVEIKAEISK